MCCCLSLVFSDLALSIILLHIVPLYLLYLLFHATGSPFFRYLVSYLFIYLFNLLMYSNLFVFIELCVAHDARFGCTITTVAEYQLAVLLSVWLLSDWPISCSSRLLCFRLAPVFLGCTYYSVGWTGTDSIISTSFQWLALNGLHLSQCFEGLHHDYWVKLVKCLIDMHRFLHFYRVLHL